MASEKATLGSEARIELTEKKSVFIATAAHVESEAEAKRFIERIRAEFDDATHNVWAYELNGGACARCSDDGEPSGTAGVPVLEAIRKGGFTDAVIVVTRYFGGILLGAGGLVRAYGAAAREAAKAAGIVTLRARTLFSIRVSFSDYRKLSYELEKAGARIDDTLYEADVTMKLSCYEEDFERLRSLSAELTGGRCRVEQLGSALG